MIDKEIEIVFTNSIINFIEDNVDEKIIWDRQFYLDSQDILDDIETLTWDVLNDS